jgi:hypothetical protein
MNREFPLPSVKARRRFGHGHLDLVPM